MTKPFFSVALSALTFSLFAAGCNASSTEDGGSGDDNGGGTSGSGGANGGSASGSGGSASGSAGTSGTSSGGASTGGASTGGAGTSGTSTGGTGGGVAGCESACARIVAAACGTTTQAECVEGCNSLAGECAAELGPYTECVSNSANAITCDTAAMAANVEGCDDVIRDLNVCGICLPATEDMACGTCTKTTCCAEAQAYVGSADIDVFDACVTPCVDQACVDTCSEASPIAGAAYATLADCQIGSCGEECICEANADDTACVACLRSGCCAELVPYVAAPDVADFATCIEPCADQACVDGCITEYPDAGNAYNTLIGCAEVSCLTECSQ